MSNKRSAWYKVALKQKHERKLRNKMFGFMEILILILIIDFQFYMYSWFTLIYCEQLGCVSVGFQMNKYFFAS